jgi:membrane associated rhomboid family serine protease
VIPLRDVIPSRTTPFVTVTLIAINTLAFLYELSLGDLLDRFIFEFGLVPASFSWLAVLTSMFLHGGLLHFGGNMLYLWIFGDNVEDRMGHGRFLVFYLLCGATAALAQTVFDPDSFVPMVGASGAIAGVMGAYFVWFPNARVLSWVFLFPLRIRARWLLLYWFASQFFLNPNEGVAWAAHVGGFVVGVLLALLI